MNRLKEFRLLRYADPEVVLTEVFGRRTARLVAHRPKAERTLRTNELKPWRELRAGCLFAHAIGLRLGQKVLVAKPERQDCDYDCVTRREVAEGTDAYGPVQIKEVVPEELNRGASLQATINKLPPHIKAPDLAVLIHLSRRIHFDPTALVVPKLQIGSLWVIGALTRDPFGEWALWGDFLAGAQGTRFVHP